MRACFLGQNVCALGYGVALVQSPPAPEEPQAETADRTAPPLPRQPLPNRMFAALKRKPHYS